MSKVSKTDVMRRINDALGVDALKKMYAALTDKELNALTKWMRKGKIGLHNDMDGFAGFTADAKGGWTSEGFEVPELERDCVTGLPVDKIRSTQETEMEKGYHPIITATITNKNILHLETTDIKFGKRLHAFLKITSANGIESVQCITDDTRTVCTFCALPGKHPAKK
jgi:hypothetical protein